MKKDQELREAYSKSTSRAATGWKILSDGAEVTSKFCDIAIDAMGKFVPGGGQISTAYSGIRKFIDWTIGK
jgi:hypothetical protein